MPHPRSPAIGNVDGLVPPVQRWGGGKGSRRGLTVTSRTSQKRPLKENRSSLHARCMISTASSYRGRLSASGIPAFV